MYVRMYVCMYVRMLYVCIYVLRYLASEEVIKATDKGMGRVKEAEHWLAVRTASYKRPEGPSSNITNRCDLYWGDLNLFLFFLTINIYIYMSRLLASIAVERQSKY